MLNLIVASLKQLFRDKQSIFWSLVFPLIFVVLFGLFDFSGSVNAHILIINKSDENVADTIQQVLQDVSGVGLNTNFTDLETAKTALKESDQVEFTFSKKDSDELETREEAVNVILYIPEGYGDYNLLKKEPYKQFDLEIYYDAADEGQVSPSGIVESIISGITDEYVLQAAGASDPFAVKREGVSVNEITYYDILVPGVIGMSIMQSGIIGMAASIASLKEKRILKRLSATPLPIWKFLLAQVISFLVLSMLQVTVMLTVSKLLLGVNIYGSIPLIYLMAFIGNFVFLNLGFITAAIAKTATAAESLSQIFTMPMMFLSGVFFARETLPIVVKGVADLLPLSPLLDALRAIMLSSKGISDVLPEIGIILVWTVVTFLLAARLFKFREE